MKRRWLSRCGLLVPLLALAGCLMMTVREEYFEPSGSGELTHEPGGAPVNTAKFAVAPGVIVQVQSRVLRGQAGLQLTARLRRPATLRFAGRDAVFTLDGVRTTVPLAWWIHDPKTSNPIGQIPLDQDIRVPDEQFGRFKFFYCTVALPAALQTANHYTVELPAPVGGQPIRLSFERKHAEYREINPQPIQ